LGAPAQDRLEGVLGDEQPPRRAELLHPGVQIAHVGRGHAAFDRLHRADPAVREVVLLRFTLDGLLESDAPQQLERPQLEVTGAGADRGAAVTLDGERRHAVMGKEQRSGETDQAAADDQNGDLVSMLEIHAANPMSDRRNGGWTGSG
jgi:hypothetical protein